MATKLPAAGVTQTSDDALNRTIWVAVRMNLAVYGSLPPDGCALSTAGANGPNRITRNTYEAMGQLRTARPMARAARQRQP